MSTRILNTGKTIEIGVKILVQNLSILIWLKIKCLYVTKNILCFIIKKMVSSFWIFSYINIYIWNKNLKNISEYDGNNKKIKEGGKKDVNLLA